MKTILNEIEFASKFCFQCKDYDYYNSEEYKELQKQKGAIRHVIFDSRKLIESIIDNGEETPPKTEVEEMLEFISWKPGLRCPKLQEAKIVINLERELEMPNTEEVALRYLDRLSNSPFTKHIHMF